jgi:hypothetical protein
VTAWAGVIALWLTAMSPVAERGTAVAGEATADPATRVTVEVFTVALGAGEEISFVRREGGLSGGANPDDRARELGVREIVLLHSTSWRWEEDGRIVLTYVAWAKDGTLPGSARPLPRLASPGATNPLRPRPPEIRELDPLAHGLRHLVFLLRTSRDGAVAAALGPRAVAALTRLEPDVAGELPLP